MVILTSRLSHCQALLDPRTVLMFCPPSPTIIPPPAQLTARAEALSGKYAVLNRRRARILREEMREGSDTFLVRLRVCVCVCVCGSSGLVAEWSAIEKVSWGNRARARVCGISRRSAGSALRDMSPSLCPASLRERLIASMSPHPVEAVLPRALRLRAPACAQVSCYLPAEASFGLADEMRRKSSGAASASRMLSHWERLLVGRWGRRHQGHRLPVVSPSCIASAVVAAHIQTPAHWPSCCTVLTL